MSSRTDYHPIKFLDRLKGNNHILLLYDKQEYADIIIARYLLNGIKNGESCIFFTSDDPKAIEKRLLAQGIGVDSCKKADTLRIYTIEKSDENKHDVLNTLNNIGKQATKGMKPPFRFVGRTITDVESRRGIQLGVTLEKIGHEHFEEFDVSQMCQYDISHIEQSRRNEWIRKLLDSHHHVIYASDPKKAVAFETMLLNEE